MKKTDAVVNDPMKLFSDAAKKGHRLSKKNHLLAYKKRQKENAIKGWKKRKKKKAAKK